MNRLRWTIENGGDYIIEWRRICLFMSIEW
jgi:hypothetical protein